MQNIKQGSLALKASERFPHWRSQVLWDVAGAEMWSGDVTCFLHDTQGRSCQHLANALPYPSPHCLPSLKSGANQSSFSSKRLRT